ncbi:GNAT family N-acetyltransferase, partial [Cronobacter sakazakii]
PGACTWGDENGGTLRGFIPVMHKNFIVAPFVGPYCGGKGIGTAPLSPVPTPYDTLSPAVYHKQTRALNFHHSRGLPS